MGGEDQTQAEARALLINTGHRPTMQCQPDEPCCSWTQIWVQAQMPDFSLNWTARSSAIKGGQRCQRCSLHTQSWPCRSRGPFSLESAIDLDTPSSTNARRSSSAEGELFMSHWSIPLCPRARVHSLNYDWLAGLCVDILVYKNNFNFVLLQGLY